MKRTLFLFFMLVVTIIGVRCYEDIVETFANNLDMTRDEVQLCFNKTSVTFEDLMHLDQVSVDDLQVIDSDDSILKAGCLFACLVQKKGLMTGAHLNMGKIKEILLLKGITKGMGQNKASELLQILDRCANRGRY